MDKDWIKAVTQLCMMAQNDLGLKSRVMDYVYWMKDVYGLQSGRFNRLYEKWLRTGEIDESMRQTGALVNELQLPLYHRGVAGMCRMLHEGILDKETFCEILWEEPYEIRADKETGYVGFYPQFPGCIGYAQTRQELKKEMWETLKKWIPQAYIFWKESSILEN
ncbi:type II toxin-antitoxin system HicB family antitoxin [Blautia sp. MSJ-19]|uniref:type II toxin-antitoxin system HicB family antitoxin n=1 Tax=Blautia sp. MSJ-19 TaxID=2841517 RepID=UPI001C0E9DA8|nr:type II toxin-antitoxin system HicB family antitoxin [Blautia sp. MSJ-19]MBU5482482.1 type II toxin-antitoxin system HicB family antitoxin [Blautia sp. MSJ-19]